eukprot:2655951-Rhodomonas_salina.1
MTAAAAAMCVWMGRQGWKVSEGGLTLGLGRGRRRTCEPDSTHPATSCAPKRRWDQRDGSTGGGSGDSGDEGSGGDRGGRGSKRGQEEKSGRARAQSSAVVGVSEGERESSSPAHCTAPADANRQAVRPPLLSWARVPCSWLITCTPPVFTPPTLHDSQLSTNQSAAIFEPLASKFDPPLHPLLALALAALSLRLT